MKMPANMQPILARLLHPALQALLSQIGAISDLPFYFVGGIVRDLLLDKPPTDIDIVVEGDGIQFAQGLCRQFGGELDTHARFGTAKWYTTPTIWQAIAPKMPTDGAPSTIDFVTARAETYPHSTALPQVQPSHIEDDLRRRDFSINTLAIRLDDDYLEQLLDHHNGWQDLQNRLIRVLHDRSFEDDPTRILRAVRFEQRLDFTIEPHTVQLLQKALPYLKEVTGGRIRQEVALLLAETKPSAILQRLDELAVLTQLHPMLKWDESVAEAFEQLPALCRHPVWQPILQPFDLLILRYILWLFPHQPDVQVAVCQRLRVRNQTEQDVIATYKLYHALSTLYQPAPSQICATIRQLTKQARVLVAVSAIAGSRRQQAIMQWVETYQSQWQHLQPTLTGNDLIALGIPPSPQIGELLTLLCDARLDGKISSEAEERQFVLAYKD